MDSLTIARYKDGYITIKEYNKSIHKNGEIFCPFCNPQLEITGVENKFFRALPKRGGHNCDRKAVEYFNAKWAGRRLVETVSSPDGNIELIVDINALSNMGRGVRKVPKPDESLSDSSEHVKKYNRYKNYKKVIRDVVRTVSQMKSLIERNKFDELDKISFKYKIGGENLGIHEIVKLVDELNVSYHGKERFVIYIVESVRVSNGKIYFNSYETNGKSVVTTFSYPSKTNRTKIKKGDMVIAFGKLSYYKPNNQYYLNTISDLNIVKMTDEDLKEKFDSKKMEKKEIYRKKVETIRPKEVAKTNPIVEEAKAFSTSELNGTKKTCANKESNIINEQVFMENKSNRVISKEGKEQISIKSNNNDGIIRKLVKGVKELFRK